MRQILCQLSTTITLAAAITTTASTRPPTDVSWGKSGVSLEQYANDASQCADTSRYVAAYIKPKTLVELDALSAAQLVEYAQWLDTGTYSDPMGDVVGITATKSPEDIARRTMNFGERYTQIASYDVRDELQVVLDKCLTERGYTQIKLNESQKRELSRFKRHTSERTAYLHSIDSDPVVIEKQKLPTQMASIKALPTKGM